MLARADVGDPVGGVPAPHWRDMVRDLLDYLNAGVKDRVEQPRQVLHRAGGQVVQYHHGVLMLTRGGFGLGGRSRL